MSEIITKQQNELAELIERHVSGDGVHITAIPSLFFIRRSDVSGPSYGVYNPSFCVVAQGAKRYGWHRSVMSTILPITLFHPLTYRLLPK